MVNLQSNGKIKSLKPNIEVCEWVVENFSTINLETGSFLTSPMIPMDHPNIKWRLALYPRGRTQSFANYLGLFVQLFSNAAQGLDIYATVTFFLINSSDEVVHASSDTCDVFTIIPETEYHIISSIPEENGREDLIERNDVLLNEHGALLVNDCLRVCCEIFFLDPLYTEGLISNYSSQNDDRLKEFDEFKKLLKDDKFGDFTLEVGNKEIRVHKAILANRSPVFDAMLKNEMQETKENRAQIADIEYSVLKALLQFMYTGTVDDTKKVTSELLIAADKYCVTGLKTLCEKTFSNELNTENALDRLVLADTYNCSYMKSQVILFIVQNSKKLIEKKEFASLRPDLMFEVIRGFSEKSTASSS